MGGAIDREAVAHVFPRARPSRTGWWRVDCPLCAGRTGKPDRNASLAVQAASGWYRCWKCHARGRIDGVDEIEEVAPPTEDAVDPPEGYEPLDGGPVSLGALKFMRSRGVDAETCEEAKIGICVRGERRDRGRIVVPVLDRAGRSWRGFVGRTFRRGDPRRKYLYNAGMRRGELLYNEAALDVGPADEAARRLGDDQEPVLVVEGVFDALPLWPDAVACLGKPSHQQIALLVAADRPIAVCLDGDAWQEGAALAYRLRVDGVRAGSVRLPPGEDPGTVDTSWIRERARRCLEEDVFP